MPQNAVMDKDIEETLLERFIRYCEVDTGSVENDGEVVPSSEGQVTLANMLKEEALQMGYEADLLPFGLRVRAKASPGREHVVPIAFAAHLDTAPQTPNAGVNVVVHRNYDGKDINLKDSVVISPETFTDLRQWVGGTIVTSDGTTLLGADDKAGIAALLTSMKYIVDNKIEHGEIDLLFTYDEETGLYGALKFDNRSDTNARYIFVLDDFFGRISIGTFNGVDTFVQLRRYPSEERSGRKAKISIAGRDAYPGHAKKEGMISAYKILPQVLDEIRRLQIPVISIEGTPGKIELEVLLNGEELSGLRNIKDDRFKWDGVSSYPVTFEVMEELVGINQAYDLGPLRNLLDNLPYDMFAEQNDGEEGYIHIANMVAEEQGVSIMILLRDFDEVGITEKKRRISLAAPDAKFRLSYSNTGMALKEHPELVQIAEEAINLTGAKQLFRRTLSRYGSEACIYSRPSDGADSKRIPAINIGLSGEGAHSAREHQPLGAMMHAVNIILNINALVVNGGYLR